MTQSLSESATHPVGSVGRRFVVVGESLIDVVVPPDGGEHEEAVGGSGLNVAVGLGRLEVPTRLVTRIGDDEMGHRIMAHLADSDVELAGDAVDPDGVTSTATATLDEQHSASYDFELVWDLPDQPLPEDALGIHIASLSYVLEPGRAAVVDLAERAAAADLFVSFDPNVRPFFVDDIEQAWRDLCVVAATARLVKLSDEDLSVLKPGAREEDVCRELLGGGVTELVVLTRGAKGAVAFTEGATLEVAAPPTDVVDSVGAGDSFMSAMLAMLCDWDVVNGGEGALVALDDARVELLVQGAVTAAAITVSRRGANPPRRPELPPTWPAS